jgi:hypothetical protein
MPDCKTTADPGFLADVSRGSNRCSPPATNCPHLADTLTEAQAEAALALIRRGMPELYPDDCDAAARQLVAAEPAH